MTPPYEITFIYSQCSLLRLSHNMFRLSFVVHKTGLRLVKSLSLLKSDVCVVASATKAK